VNASLLQGVGEEVGVVHPINHCVFACVIIRTFKGTVSGIVKEAWLNVPGFQMKMCAVRGERAGRQHSAASDEP